MWQFQVNSLTYADNRCRTHSADHDFSNILSLCRGLCLYAIDDAFGVSVTLAEIKVILSQLSSLDVAAVAAVVTVARLRHVLHLLLLGVDAGTVDIDMSRAYQEVDSVFSIQIAAAHLLVLFQTDLAAVFELHLVGTPRLLEVAVVDVEGAFVARARAVREVAVGVRNRALISHCDIATAVVPFVVTIIDNVVVGVDIVVTIVSRGVFPSVRVPRGVDLLSS